MDPTLTENQLIELIAEAVSAERSSNGEKYERMELPTLFEEILSKVFNLEDPF